MGMNRYEKQLRYQKSQSITTGVGKPGSSEGSNGAITIRNINGQVTLFGKYNGIWYGRDLGPTMIVGEKNMTHLSIDRKGINAMDGFTSLAHFGETLRIGPDSATKTAFRGASDGTASIGTSGTAKVTMSSAGVLTVTDILLSGRIGYVTGSTSKNILIGSVGGTSYPCPDVTDINTAYFLGNVVIGDDACQQVNVDNTDVFRYNVAIGNNAMKDYDPVAHSAVVNSDSNVAIGHSAMQNFHQGLKNTAIGAGALLGSDSTGSFNICIGFTSGENITSGSGNVVIGDSNVTTADGNNQLVIASGGAASPVTWLTGDSSGNVLMTGAQQLQFNASSQHITSTANDMTITSTRHLTIDVGGDIILDAAGDNITLLDNGGTYTPTAASDATTKAYVDANAYHFIKAGFFNSGTSKIFIPIAGSDSLREGTSSTGTSETICFICPFDGSVETVWARSEEACGSTEIGLYATHTAAEIPGPGTTQTVTVDMSVDDTSYKFDFAGAGTNTFSQGNVIAFSVDPTSAMNDTHFVIVLKFDVTT